MIASGVGDVALEIYARLHGFPMSFFNELRISRNLTT